MSELAFEGLAEEYERWRPRYPPEILRALVADVDGAGPRGDGLLVDVGAGSGISTRLVRDVFGGGPPIIGIESGADMLRKAWAATPYDAMIEYRTGEAERLPLGSDSAVLVLAAQAIQWFDRAAFLAEAARVLRPRGVVALLQNDRQWAVGGAAASLEDFLERHSPGYSRHYRSFDLTQELSAAPGFGAARSVNVRWTRALSQRGFVAMALTSSKTRAAGRVIGIDAVHEQLTAIARAAASCDGKVVIPYITRLHWACRACSAPQVSGLG